MVGDARLESIAVDLEGELEPLRHHLDPIAAKRHFENYTLLQDRDSRGLSRRASNS